MNGMLSSVIPKERTPKRHCSKGIGLRSQNMLTISNSLVNITGGGGGGVI